MYDKKIRVRTMRAKDCRITIRLTEKNRIYLERLGQLDGRTGRKKTRQLGIAEIGESNLNEFVNTCITLVLEHDMSQYATIANSEELLSAYVKYHTGRRNREILRLQEENSLVSRFRKNVTIKE